MIAISLIIPIYNSQARLCECLESIFAQTYKNFEIICINDNSKDNSLEILENYQIKHPHFKIINSAQHIGVGEARNLGIKEAKGEYLSFIDSDDTISSNFLYELLKTAQETDSEICACNFFTKRKRKTKKILLKKFDSKLKFVSNGSCCNKLFKTSLIKENEIFFPKNVYYEDNLFLIKALYFSKKFSTTNKATYYYFSNPSSITRNKLINKHKKMHSTNFILNEIFNFAKKKVFSKNQIKLLKNFCLKSFINGEFLNNKFFIENLPEILKNDKNFAKNSSKANYSNFCELILSFKNSKDKTKKIITFFGLNFSFERKKVEKQ